MDFDFPVCLHFFFIFQEILASLIIYLRLCHSYCLHARCNFGNLPFSLRNTVWKNIFYQPVSQTQNVFQGLMGCYPFICVCTHSALMHCAHKDPQNSSRRWTDLMIAAHKCKHCSMCVCARTKWQPRDRNVTPFTGALQLPTGAPTSYRSASSPKMNKSLQRSQQL